MCDGCIKKKRKKDCCCKQCISQKQENATQQSAAAAAAAGDAINVNIVALFNKSPQNVYGGDAAAVATNSNVTQQVQQAAQACDGDAETNAANVIGVSL